jgi:hypothetical protein
LHCVLCSHILPLHSSVAFSLSCSRSTSFTFFTIAFVYMFTNSATATRNTIIFSYIVFTKSTTRILGNHVFLYYAHIFLILITLFCNHIHNINKIVYINIFIILTLYHI